MSTAVRTYSRGRKLVAMRDLQAGASRYYHYDHQGTTQCLTDGTGTVTDRFAADAWGMPVKRTGNSINRAWYVGGRGYYQRVDRASLYVRARYLNAAMSSWLTRDHVIRRSGYVYVSQSPSRYVDSSGHYKCSLEKPLTVVTYVSAGFAPELPGEDIDPRPKIIIRPFNMVAVAFFSANAIIRCDREPGDPLNCPCRRLPPNVAACQGYQGLLSFRHGTEYQRDQVALKHWCPDNHLNKPQARIIDDGSCKTQDWRMDKGSYFITPLNGQSTSGTCRWNVCVGDAPGFSNLDLRMDRHTCALSATPFHKPRTDVRALTQADLTQFMSSDKLLVDINLPLWFDLVWETWLCKDKTGTPFDGSQALVWGMKFSVNAPSTKSGPEALVWSGVQLHPPSVLTQDVQRR